MHEYQGAIDIKATPEQVFRFLSSVGNVPEFLPHIKEARLDKESHVFAVGEISGRRYEFDGYFRVTPENRHIDWGSDGTPPYRGWLEVREAGDAARLEVHLFMDVARPDQSAERALDDVLLTIRHRIEDEGAGKILGEERNVA